jgi:uncharacterized SAM-binding protein YcdF (DUF218 family)
VRWLFKRRPFALGVAMGIVAMLGGRQLINRTSLADSLIAPLWLDDTSGPADMIDLAEQLGVPAMAVRIEDASRNTRENALFSQPMLQKEGVRRILVVTDRLHMPRATGVFARLNFAVERASVPVYAGHVDNVSMLLAGAREYAALLYYRWKGWIGDPAAGHQSAVLVGSASPLRVFLLYA